MGSGLLLDEQSCFVLSATPMSFKPGGNLRFVESGLLDELIGADITSISPPWTTIADIRRLLRHGWFCFGVRFLSHDIVDVESSCGATWSDNGFVGWPK